MNIHQNEENGSILEPIWTNLLHGVFFGGGQNYEYPPKRRKLGIIVPPLSKTILKSGFHPKIGGGTRTFCVPPLPLFAPHVTFFCHSSFLSKVQRIQTATEIPNSLQMYILHRNFGRTCVALFWSTNSYIFGISLELNFGQHRATTLLVNSDIFLEFRSD